MKTKYFILSLFVGIFALLAVADVSAWSGWGYAPSYGSHVYYGHGDSHYNLGYYRTYPSHADSFYTFNDDSLRHYSQYNIHDTYRFMNYNQNRYPTSFQTNPSGYQWSQSGYGFGGYNSYSY